MLAVFLLQMSALVHTCAPEIAPETMLALVQVESGGNPLAIGVVGARLKTPPTTVEEALLVTEQLEGLGKNFDVGLAQLNQKYLAKLGLTYELAFDPCENLKAASKVLKDCYQRAKKRSAFVEEQTALSDALSCYNSGNFTRGYKPGPKGEPSYVEQVRAAVQPLPLYVVPSLTLPFETPPSLSFPPPVSVKVSPAPKAPETPLLVPSTSCQGVVLGSPCSTPASVPPAAAPSSPSTQQRKEAAIF
jgi:type IV secretion system protein VirB1